MHHITFLSLAAILLVAACSDDSAVVDSTLNESAIALLDMELSDYVVDTDTLNVKAGQDKTVDDPVLIPFTLRARILNHDGVGALRFEIRQDGKTPLLEEGDMHASSEAGVYESAVLFPRKRGDVGDYRVEVFVSDKDGRRANSGQAKLRVIYGSKPPQILSVVAPDTVVLGLQAIVLNISAEVTDPSGKADIKQVFFNSFLPGGHPSSKNPFILLDNGQPASGDVTAGDGFYSIRVQMPPDTQKGEYRFEFRALDYSGLSSNVVIHKIIVR